MPDKKPPRSKEIFLEALMEYIKTERGFGRRLSDIVDFNTFDRQRLCAIYERIERERGAA